MARNLESRERVRGSKRKTVLYWRKLIREAGWDVTEIGKQAQDRKKWKAAVMARMKHLAEWEESRGKKWEGAAMERNGEMEVKFVFDCDVCGKVC